MSPLFVDCDQEESPKWPLTVNQSPMTSTAPAAVRNCSRWTRQATQVIVAGVPSRSTSGSPTLQFHDCQTQQQKSKTEKNCRLNSLERPVVTVRLILNDEMQMGQSRAVSCAGVRQVRFTSTHVVALDVVRPRPGPAGRGTQPIRWQQRGVKLPAPVDGQSG